MEIGRRFFQGTAADVPATGNAPVLMTRKDFEVIMPVWADIVLAIENDTVAVDRLGWVRDMYAWSFAAAKVKLTHVLPLPPHNPLMVQPPADRRARGAENAHTQRTPSFTVSLGAQPPPARALGRRNFRVRNRTELRWPHH